MVRMGIGAIISAIATMDQLGRSLLREGVRRRKLRRVKLAIRSQAIASFGPDAQFVLRSCLGRQRLVSDLISADANQRQRVVDHLRDAFEEAGRSWTPIQEERSAAFLSGVREVLLRYGVHETQVSTELVRDDIQRVTYTVEAVESVARSIQGEVQRPSPFLTLDEFRGVLQARDETGFSVPFVRSGWDEGGAKIQLALRGLWQGEGSRILLVSAHGGFGKTRSILELGRWFSEEFGEPVRVLDGGGHSARDQVIHLPTHGLLLVDNAEQARLGELLDEIGRSAEHSHLVILAFVRPPFVRAVISDLGSRVGVSELRDALPNLTFKEASEIMCSLGVTNDRYQRILYSHSNRVPLFLILLTKRLLAGDSPYRLTAEQSSLDGYIYEVLDTLEVDGVTRHTATLVLAALSLLRVIEDRSPRSVPLVAALVDLPEGQVRSAIEAGVRAGVLERKRSGVKFAYDLVAERWGVLFGNASLAKSIVRAFFSEELAAPFEVVFQQCLVLESQLGDRFLQDLVLEITRGAESADNFRREGLIDYALEPLLRLRPEDALVLAEAVASFPQPRTERRYGSFVVAKDHREILEKILKKLQPYARPTQFGRRWLGLVSLIVTRGVDVPTSALEDLVRRLSRPDFESARPFLGLDAVLNVLASWTAAPTELAKIAVAGLGMFFKTTFEISTINPDNRFELQLQQGTVRLEDEDYESQYRAAQDVLLSVSTEVVELYGELVVQESVNAISGLLAVRNRDEPGAAWIELARRWLEGIGTLARRASPVILGPIRTQLQWFILHGPVGLADLAQRVLRDIDELPGMAASRLFVIGVGIDDVRGDAPDVSGDPEARFQRQGRRLAAIEGELAAEVQRAMSTDELLSLLQSAVGGTAIQRLSWGLLRLYEADEDFAQAVMEALLQDDQLKYAALSCLGVVAKYRLSFALAMIADASGMDDAQAQLAIVPPSVQLVGQVAEVEPLIRRLVESESSSVRVAILEKLYGLPPELAVDILLRCLEIDGTNGAVTRSANSALIGLSLQGRIDAGTAKKILSRSVQVPWFELTAYEHGFLGLVHQAAASDPELVLQHLEARAEAQEAGAQGLLPAFGGGEVFATCEWSDATLQACLDRIASWLVASELPVLRRIAPGVFGSLVDSRPEVAVTFVEALVSQASDLGGYLDAVNFASAVHQDAQRITLLEEALVEGYKAQLASEDLRRLRAAAAGSFTNGVMKQGIAGEPFPLDLRLLELAGSRIEMAEDRIQRGEGGFVVVRDMWLELKRRAQHDIEQAGVDDDDL